MKRRFGCMLPALLMLMLQAGCAGSHQAAPTAGPELRSSEAVALAKLRGAYIRVQLRSGESVSGEVRDVSEESFTLVRPRDHSFRERAVPIAAVDHLEVFADAGKNHLGASLAGILALSAALFVLVLKGAIYVE